MFTSARHVLQLALKDTYLLAGRQVDCFHVSEGGSPDEALERILAALLQDFMQLFNV